MFLFREFQINPNKEIRVALQSIYGINWFKSNYIVSKVGISNPFYLKNINIYNFYLILYLLKGLVISEVRIKRRIDLILN